MITQQKFFLCYFLLLINFTALHAQQTKKIIQGDTVLLQIESYRGQIQWQQSTGTGWNDLPNAIAGTHKIKVIATPVFFRAKIQEADCNPHYSEIILVESDYALWSDPLTWNGNKPTAGQNVLIPEGLQVLLDESPPALGGITIEGELRFMDKDLNLSAKWIMVEDGKLQVGIESNPFRHKAIITLTDTNTAEDIMGMGTRGLFVMGGQLELHGETPTVLQTKLNQHAAAGSTSFVLKDDIDWKVGSEIVIGPTDFYGAANGNSMTQRLTLTAINNNQVLTSTAVSAFRWGLLQYATTSGMSLSPTGLVTPPTPNTAEASTPTVLDERAPVGLLTRNIVIQAPDDGLWSTQGFGVHTMIMGNGAQAHVDGVEFRRGGKRAELARYPFHWHMLSYSGSQTLSDATGQYIKRSVINSSRNRGIVIHGTNGILVQDNIVFDVEGHGIFTEDAVERRNTFDGNLVLRIRRPNVSPGVALKQHEIQERGASCFWISNPDNVLTNNTAADCATNGFWLAFPQNPWGLNQTVLAEDGLVMNPSRILFGVFDNNTAHSNGKEGIMLDNVEINNAGNTFPFQYASTTNGRSPVWPPTTLRSFKLSRYNVWKNLGEGMWDRGRRPNNYGVVSADNCGRFFAGSGDDGVIEKSLVIGTSLNHLMNGTGRPTDVDPFTNFIPSTPAAFATYHSTFDIKNNIIVNFPAVENTRSGVFSTEDYYVRPVDKGHLRNTNNLFINAHPGVKLRAPFSYFTLASALLDAQGIWGPAGNYFVYNDLFLTHGKTISPVSPNSQTAGGVSVPGPFYGFEGFVLHGVGDTPPQNQPYFDLMKLNIRRLDANLNEVGVLTIDAAQSDWLLQHMRHFSTSPDGIYELTFPAEATLPTNFQVYVENMLTNADTQVIGIQYDGNRNPTVGLGYPAGFQPYQAVNSLTEVIASPGETWWQDKPNNMVWVKLRGGRWQFWTTNPDVAVPTSDELLYETSTLRIFVQN